MGCRNPEPLKAPWDRNPDPPIPPDLATLIGPKAALLCVDAPAPDAKAPPLPARDIFYYQQDVSGSYTDGAEKDREIDFPCLFR